VESFYCLGVVISILYDDYAPPHFRDAYGEYRIIVQVDTGKIEGLFPRRALLAVMAWYIQHRDELTENWLRSQKHEPLERIELLE